MQIQTLFVIKFNIEGRDYSFNVYAGNEREAVSKLAKDLGIVVEEMSASIA